MLPQRRKIAGFRFYFPRIALFRMPCHHLPAIVMVIAKSQRYAFILILKNASFSRQKRAYR
jgi:hypothetical protein